MSGDTVGMVATVGTALIGGTIGSMFGQPQLGFAAGWMLGAWLFGPQQAGNEIFDPGAEEMPRFTQALRGATMPVMFGTNKVSSHLVWQANFVAHRHESGGGGKAGGSGGGGKSGPTSVSYTYTWDLVYNLGMAPVPVAFYGGWMNGERIASSSIASLAAGNPAPFTFGGEVDSENPNEIDIRAQEYFFWDASGNGSVGNAANLEGWAHLETETGFPIRWPHTVTIGFRQLELGALPRVPTLWWECGPGDAELTFNSGFRGLQNVTQQNIQSTTYTKGADGNLYVVDDNRNIFSVTTGARTQAVDNTTFQSLATAAGLTTRTYNTHAWGGSLNEDYILLLGANLQTGANIIYAWVLCTIDSSGQAVAVGGWECHSGSISDNYLNGDGISLNMTGNKGADDPILFTYDTFNTHSYRILVLPSINQMLGPLIESSGAPWQARNADFDTIVDEFHAASSHAPNDQRTNGFTLPKATITAVGVQYSTRYYIYIPRAKVQWAIDNPGSNGGAWIDTESATYPNGFIAYWEKDDILYDDAGPGFTGTPINANADFVDQSGTSTFPFDDAGTNFAGDPETGHDYYQHPSVIKLTQDGLAGAYLVIFQKIYRGSDDLSPTGTFTKARAYIYNPLTTKFTEIADGIGSLYDTVADVGEDEGDRYDYIADSTYVFYNETDHSLQVSEQVNGPIGGPWDSAYVASTMGSLDISGGSDVLPPYIIYEILTNNVFGLGYTDADIDMDSYQAALLYCQSQEIYVSMYITRETSALRVIEQVLSVYGGFLTVNGGQIKFHVVDIVSSVATTIDNDHLITTDDGGFPIRIIQGARQDTFNKVVVNYIDRSLEYHQNQIEENDEVDQDLRGVRKREYPATFVMSELSARRMAIRTLYHNLYSKDTYEFAVGYSKSWLAAGDVITLVDSHHAPLSTGVKARITQIVEGPSRGIFQIQAKREFDYIVTASVEALNVSSQSDARRAFAPPLNRYQAVYELPCEFQQTDTGRMYAGFVPDGFAQSAVMYVSADGVSYGPVSEANVYPLNGTLLTGMPNMSHGSIQENVEVLLSPTSGWTASSPAYHRNETLSDISPANRSGGVSLIWIGSEMIAYEGATLRGQNRYALGRVYRGWGGTHIHNHSSGDFWFKHGAGIMFQDFGEADIGTTFYYKILARNIDGNVPDVSSVQANTYTIQGSHFKPQVSPTPRYVSNSVDHGQKYTHYVGSAADIAIDWRDGARKAGYGAGGFGLGTGGYGRFTADATSHNWNVSVIGSGDVLVRSLEVTTSTYTYTNSNNFADNGAWRGNVAFSITPTNVYGNAPRTEVISLDLWQ